LLAGEDSVAARFVLAAAVPRRATTAARGAAPQNDHSMCLMCISVVMGPFCHQQLCREKGDHAKTHILILHALV